MNSGSNSTLLLNSSKASANDDDIKYFPFYPQIKYIFFFFNKSISHMVETSIFVKKKGGNENFFILYWIIFHVWFICLLAVKIIKVI